MKKILLVLTVCSMSLQAASVYVHNPLPKTVKLKANGTTVSCEGIALGIFSAGAGLAGAALAEHHIDTGKVTPGWNERIIEIPSGQTVGICRAKATPLIVWTDDKSIKFQGKGHNEFFGQRVEVPAGLQIWQISTQNN